MLGGNVAILEKLFPNEEDAADIVQRLVREALEQPNVTIHTQAEVESADGYVGNFSVAVRQAADGATLVGGARRCARRHVSDVRGLRPGHRQRCRGGTGSR